MRRSLVLVGFLGLFIGLTPGVAAARHDTALPNILDMNICGDACNAHGNTTIVQTIGDRVRDMSVRPAAILLQEICEQQFSYLVNRLAAYGYVGHMHGIDPDESTCGNDGHRWGVSVFWLGGEDTSASPYTYVYQNQPHIPLRMISCGRQSVASRCFPFFTACSTHLDQSATLYTAAESNEFRNLIAFFNGLGTNSFGGGDFNARPNLSMFDAWYSAWLEGDGAGRTGYANTTDGGQKLDYIWG